MEKTPRKSPFVVKINIGDNCFPLENGDCAHWGFAIYENRNQSDGVRLTPAQWIQQYDEAYLPVPEYLDLYIHHIENTDTRGNCFKWFHKAPKC